MKRILVTGASGFLGSQICDVLLDGGYEVHALIRVTSSTDWLREDKMTIHRCGINDCPELHSILARMDAVVHNAGATSRYPTAQMYDTNVEKSMMLARACVGAGVKRYCFISSQAAGGPSNGKSPRTEDQPDNPISTYGRSKREAEEHLSLLKDKLHLVILRFPTIYGPRGEEMLQVFKMIAGRNHIMPGFKSIYTSMVYVEDAARAVLAVLRAKVASGSKFYISDNIDYSNEYLYDLLEDAFENPGRRIRVPLWLVSLAAWWQSVILKKKTSLTPEKVKEMRQRFWLVSSQKAIDVLGWKPEVMPEQGFARTIRWYKYKKWL